MEHIEHTMIRKCVEILMHFTQLLFIIHNHSYHGELSPQKTHTYTHVKTGVQFLKETLRVFWKNSFRNAEVNFPWAWGSQSTAMITIGLGWKTTHILQLCLDPLEDRDWQSSHLVRILFSWIHSVWFHELILNSSRWFFITWTECPSNHLSFTPICEGQVSPSES